jgi:Arc/MetJ family transcription regulator
VYDWCLSRTYLDLDIDDAACRVVMERFGLDSMRDAVNLALRRLAGEPLDRGEARGTPGQRERR